MDYKTKYYKYKQKYLTLKRKQIQQNGGYVPIDKSVFDANGYAATYGELTEQGMAEMLKSVNNREQKTFYDLGSGLGTPTILAGQRFGFEKSVGIELAKERHAEAVKRLNDLPPDVKNKIEFYNQDLFESDIRDADVIFVSNLCFDEKTNSKLIKKIESEGKPGLTVFTSKKIESPRLKFQTSFPVEMTWSKSSTIYQHQLLP